MKKKPVSQKRNVQYDKSLLTHIDILGFRGLIEEKTANEISRTIRVVREAVEPDRFKSTFSELSDDNYVNFSDLSIIRTPLCRNGAFLQKGSVYAHILRLIHTQSILLFDHGVLIRGGMTVGNATMSYRQLFGPAVVRAYDLESTVARFPRIVVDERVLEEVNDNPELWVHDRETEIRGVRSLLRRDFDGELFVDYLSVIREELDDPSMFPSYLKRHQHFIEKGLTKYRGNPSVLSKFKWLKEYHSRIVRRIKKNG
jgi:hypothetical protein